MSDVASCRSRSPLEPNPQDMICKHSEEGHNTLTFGKDYVRCYQCDQKWLPEEKGECSRCIYNDKCDLECKCKCHKKANQGGCICENKFLCLPEHNCPCTVCHKDGDYNQENPQKPSEEERWKIAYKLFDLFGSIVEMDEKERKRVIDQLNALRPFL